MRKKRKERSDRCDEQDPVKTSCQVEGRARSFNSSVEGINEEKVGIDQAQSCDTALTSAIANLTTEVVKICQTQEQMVEGIWPIADKVNALAMGNTSEQLNIAARVEPFFKTQSDAQ